MRSYTYHQVPSCGLTPEAKRVADALMTLVVDWDEAVAAKEAAVAELVEARVAIRALTAELAHVTTERDRALAQADAVEHGAQRTAAHVDRLRLVKGGE